MDQNSSPSTAHDRQSNAEGLDATSRSAGSDEARDSDSPAGTEEPHEEEKWESEGGNPA